MPIETLGLGAAPPKKKEPGPGGLKLVIPVRRLCHLVEMVTWGQSTRRLI